MPGRPRPELPPDRRQAIIRELLLFRERQRRAELDTMIYVSFATEAGLTTREIGMELGISNSTAALWSRRGREERERRDDPSPLPA